VQADSSWQALLVDGKARPPVNHIPRTVGGVFVWFCPCGLGRSRLATERRLTERVPREMSIFRRVTKVSFVRGTSILVILIGAVGPHAERWGVAGFHLRGVPLWCFGVLGSVGGILFFLWPMIYGSDTPLRSETESRSSERMLFLYLRPFELDAETILQLILGASVGPLVYTGMIYGIWWPLSFMPLVISISKEQAFQDVFERLGDFVAFGKPRELLRPIGASRIYAGQDWRQVMIGHIARARLVIVRPGTSKSIRWEVRQVLKSQTPERVLFYLRFRGRKKKREQAYKAFRGLFHKRHPTKELPESLDNGTYLTFDAHWNPYFIRETNLPGAILGQVVSRSEDIAAKRLRPVLNALSLEVSSQPVPKLILGVTWLLISMSAGLLVFAIIVAVVGVVKALVLWFSA
jgi:hypothetical protein